MPLQNNSWMIIWKWKKRLNNILLFYTSKQCTIRSNHKCNVFWQIRRQWFVFSTFSNCIATLCDVRCMKNEIDFAPVFFTCISEVRVCQITGLYVFVFFPFFFVFFCIRITIIFKTDKMIWGKHSTNNENMKQ